MPATFLCLFDRIDDADMGTAGKDHQAFSFQVKEEGLLTPEIVRFGFFSSLDEQTGRHLFIGRGPLDVAGEIGPGNDLRRRLNLHHLESEGFDILFFQLPDVHGLTASGAQRISPVKGLIAHVKGGSLWRSAPGSVSGFPPRP